VWKKVKAPKIMIDELTKALFLIDGKAGEK